MADFKHRGSVTFTNLKDHFGGSATNINLGDFYRGGARVANQSGNARVPVSGNKIDVSDFFNTRTDDLDCWVFDSTNFCHNGMTLNYTGGAHNILIVVADGSTDCGNFLSYINNTYYGSVPQRNTGRGAIGSIFNDHPAIYIEALPTNSFVWIRNYGDIYGASGSGIAIQVDTTGSNILIDSMGTTSNIGGGGNGDVYPDPPTNGFVNTDTPNSTNYKVGTLGDAAAISATAPQWIVVRDNPSIG